MAYCRYCGKKFTGNENFCANCGANRVDGTADTGAAQDTQNVQPQVVTPGAEQQEDINKMKAVCAISYISILFFIPLISYPGSKFAKFHANQALLLLIATTILSTGASIVSGVFGALPFVPAGLSLAASTLLGGVSGLVSLAGMIFGIITAANGDTKELPIIGKINLINK